MQFSAVRQTVWDRTAVLTALLLDALFPKYPKCENRRNNDCSYKNDTIPIKQVWEVEPKCPYYVFGYVCTITFLAMISVICDREMKVDFYSSSSVSSNAKATFLFFRLRVVVVVVVLLFPAEVVVVVALASAVGSPRAASAALSAGRSSLSA